MTDRDHDDDLRALWQGEPPGRPGIEPSAEELAASAARVDEKARRLARTVRNRNLREYLAVLVVAPFFAVAAARSDGIVTALGHALVAVGAVFVALHLRARGGNLPPPAADAPTRERVAHYRAELSRQRDLLASVARWYILPFAPGMLLFLAGTGIDLVKHGLPPQHAALALGSTLLVMAATAAVVLLLNRRAARAMGREIEALDE